MYLANKLKKHVIGCQTLQAFETIPVEMCISLTDLDITQLKKLMLRHHNRSCIEREKLYGGTKKDIYGEREQTYGLV